MNIGKEEKEIEVVPKENPVPKKEETTPVEEPSKEERHVPEPAKQSAYAR